MKVITELKQRDLLGFNTRSILRVKSTYISTVFISILLFGVLVYLKGFPSSINDWVAISLASVGGGIGGMVISVSISLLLILFSSNGKNGVLGKHEYTITDEGLHEKTSVNEGLSKWEGIEDIKVFGPYLLFQITDYLFHIIPKSSFSSEQEYKDFIEVALNKWKSASVMH